MWLTSLFKSAPKAVDNVLDKDDGLLTQFGGWIGNMKLTDEEVMKANAETVVSVQGFVKDTLSESTARSQTRRSLAVGWFDMVKALILFCCIAAPWNMELASFYFGMVTSVTVASVTTAITIFFFGSHGLARYQESKKDK